MATTSEFFSKPILNSPYDAPARHWELDEDRKPTGVVLDSRRPSRLVTAVPKAKKQGGQEDLRLGRPASALISSKPTPLIQSESNAMPDKPPPRFTERQGQYLAFIHAYTKIHRQPPAQADLSRYFRVSPPSVHQMLLTLERRGLLRRTPGQARAIEVLVPPEDLPLLL